MPNTRSRQSPPPDRNKARRQYDRHQSQYKSVLRRLYGRVRGLLAKRGIKANCAYRLKSFDSYFDKLLRLHSRKNGPVVVTDLLALRIVCPFLSDLDDVERLLKESLPIVESERKGARHSYREFGYDSIHLLVEMGPKALPGTIPRAAKVCEIQIRTILQDAWAEVEHEIIYKGGQSLFNEAIKRKLAALNATLTLSDITFQEIRDFQREVLTRGARRRESLQEKVHDLNSISILSVVPEPSPRPALNAPLFPVQPKGTLERLIFEALEAHGNNRFEEAIRIYTRILRMKPPEPVRAIIHNHRGMAHFVLSRYQRALRDFSRVVAIDENNTRGLNNRALVLRMLGQHRAALEDLDRSLHLDSFQVDPYYIRALTRYSLGEFIEGLADCERALNLQADFAPAARLRRILAAQTVR